MKLLLTLIIAIILFVVYVRFLEETSIFYPTRSLTSTPKNVGLDYEDVYFKTQDGIKLNGWFVKAPRARNTLVFFHGNAGNIGDRLDKISLFNKFGVNVFIVDYRGYGKSEGKPSEKGIYRDAAAAYDYLIARPDVTPESLIIFGVSLGGVVAVDLAANKKAACLIVDSTFSSAADIAKVIYPFVPSFLLKTKMDSMLKIQGVSVPKLFMHSRQDMTVPFELGKKLFDAANAPKEFVEIQGGHDDGYSISSEKYWSAIGVFLKKHSLM